MSFPRYSEYKDSGVEWLGEVAAHWTLVRLKNAAALNMGQSPSSVDCNDVGEGLPFLQGNADFGTIYPVPRSFCPVANKVANEGDILFSVRAPVGAINVADQRYGIGRGLCAITANQEHCPDFLLYLLELMKSELLSVATGSTYEAVTTEQVANARYISPPFNEQVTIAAFLDHETAKIDALVAEQEKLIALLKEKRQAVISHAVTKGLNPDAPMKDSGIEWLGEVPAQWEVGPLKRFAEVVDCKHHTVQFLDEGLPIVSIRELRDDQIELTDAKLTSRDEWDFLREGRVPQRGDMVFCRNASVGAVGYVDFDEPFCMGQDVCLIRADSASRFMHFQLTSALIRNQIEGLLVGATIRRANVEEIRGLLVAHPSASEQDEIAKYLVAITGEFDALSADAETAISLLKERRSALISAAVTGKIDVRGFGAQKEAA